MRKIFLCIITFACFTQFVAAFQVEGTLDKTSIDINEQAVFQLVVTPEEAEEISAPRVIPGMENFEVSTQQQTRSYVSAVSLDGNMQQQVERKIFVNYILTPKKAGTFQIGPVTLSSGSGSKTIEKKTLTVSGEKLFTKNNDWLDKKIQKTNQTSKDTSKKQQGENQQKKVSPYKLGLIVGEVLGTILGVVLIVSLFVFVFRKKLIKGNPKQIKEETVVQPIKIEEPTVLESLELPKVGDQYFFQKMNNYVRIELAKKIGISKDVSSLGVQELFDKLPKKEENKELQSLITQLYKGEYMKDAHISEQEVLEGVQKWFNG